MSSQRERSYLWQFWFVMKKKIHVQKVTYILNCYKLRHGHPARDGNGWRHTVPPKQIQ